MLCELTTHRAGEMGQTPWEVYPRPQLRRDNYVNLNGEWDFAVSRNGELPEAYPEKIRVPFCPESALSGLKREIPPGSWLFYRRELSLKEDLRGKRVLLHVGAADQVLYIYVNRELVGIHEGGYTAFHLDIGDWLKERNELVLCCYDNLRDRRYPYGKQTLRRGGMWYTPVSGIWQTVWLETVPEHYIESPNIETDMEGATVTLTPAMAGTVCFEGREYPLKNGAVRIIPESPRLWSPEDPHLYPFTVQAGDDRVESYFALRGIDVRTFKGIPRLCLNGKPYFFHGLLDQGYWPDGIYTPATPACYADDILAMKKLGFNTLRKHIKVEPEEFYYQCDRLGMVVFQDMVNNGPYSFFRDTALPTLGIRKLPDRWLHPRKSHRAMFLRTMEETVAQLRNHPSILYWTIFNEAWGQFAADAVYDRLKALEGSRIIDATSGWFRRKRSDVDSRHVYFRSLNKLRYEDKPLVLSEFGGYTCALKGHLFNPDKSYGYKTCADPEEYRRQLGQLYREQVLPAVERGLCATVYTQVSDVEDEINGLLTYDRKVCKADAAEMTAIGAQLQQALLQSCGLY